MSEQPVSTLELRDHVVELEAERALARLYVAAAVTEIATQRAELFGAEAG